MCELKNIFKIVLIITFSAIFYLIVGNNYPILFSGFFVIGLGFSQMITAESYKNTIKQVFNITIPCKKEKKTKMP